MRDEIERRLGLRALDIYGLSEMIGPGVASECTEQVGRARLRGPLRRRGRRPGRRAPLLPDGVEGELVFTSLTREAMPLLRYRTGDLASLSREPCACGRTLARISRIKGRTDDMLVVRGVNVFPSEVESTLLSVPGLAPHYQLRLQRPGRARRPDRRGRGGRLGLRPARARGRGGAPARSRARARLPGARARRARDSRARRARRCACSTNARSERRRRRQLERPQREQRASHTACSSRHEATETAGR